MSIEKLSPFHVKKYGNGPIPRSTLTWKKNGNLPVGHPCPIAKGLGDAMREILDFCIFISKTELWQYQVLETVSPKQQETLHRFV